MSNAADEVRALLATSDAVHHWPDETRVTLPVPLAALRALVAELEAARAEQAKLTRERDDAWECRDEWHARVAHIGQALGMQPPPSGDWRDVDAAAVERVAQGARAAVEAARGNEGASWAQLLAAIDNYDAAKAGKAVE